MREAPCRTPHSNIRKTFDFREKVLFIAVLTVALTAINILAGLLHVRLLGQPEIIAQFNGISEIIAISARAALLEEIIFRFIMITVIMHLQQMLSKYYKTSIHRMWLVALTISSLAFMFVHSAEAYLIAFTFGMLLGYTFMKYGIVDAIVVHFLVNVGTYTYLYLCFYCKFT